MSSLGLDNFKCCLQASIPTILKVCDSFHIFGSALLAATAGMMLYNDEPHPGLVSSM